MDVAGEGFLIVLYETCIGGAGAYGEDLSWVDCKVYSLKAWAQQYDMLVYIYLWRNFICQCITFLYI